MMMYVILHQYTMFIFARHFRVMLLFLQKKSHLAVADAEHGMWILYGHDLCIMPSTGEQTGRHDAK